MSWLIYQSVRSELASPLVKIYASYNKEFMADMEIEFAVPPILPHSESGYIDRK